jgi:hypothetical protein
MVVGTEPTTFRNQGIGARSVAALRDNRHELPEGRAANRTFNRPNAHDAIADNVTRTSLGYWYSLTYPRIIACLALVMSLKVRHP